MIDKKEINILKYNYIKTNAMKKIFTALLLTVVSFIGNNAQEWDPQVHLTGYVNTTFEYTTLSNLDTKTGIGLADAGFLASYKPLENVELKATLVYTHHVKDIQSLLVEAYGTYEFNRALKLGAGKFLTPLSPVNTYFYAPLNISVTLPMLVSHHFLLPQSISGFQISGETGDDFIFKYNATYGNYLNLGHPKTGILSVQGREDNFPLGHVPDFESQYLLGGSARAEFAYQDIFKFGLNYFDGTESTHLIQTQDGTEFTEATKYSWGIDGHISFSGFYVDGEYWKGHQETTDLPVKQESDYTGYYAQVYYQNGSVSPFVRYDYVDDLSSDILQAPTTAYSIGVAFRPIYELMFKLEFRKVDIDYASEVPQVIELLKGVDHSYNSILFSTVVSF